MKVTEATREGDEVNTLPLVMVDVTEGLKTSPLNNTIGFK